MGQSYSNYFVCSPLTDVFVCNLVFYMFICILNVTCQNNDSQFTGNVTISYLTNETRAPRLAHEPNQTYFSSDNFLLHFLSLLLLLDTPLVFANYPWKVLPTFKVITSGAIHHNYILLGVETCLLFLKRKRIKEKSEEHWYFLRQIRFQERIQMEIGSCRNCLNSTL